MATIEMVDNPADGTTNPGGHFHAAEFDNLTRGANGFGALLETYSMTVTGSDMVVTIPAFDAVVPDGSGGLKVVSKSSATNVTMATADGDDPRTDIIHVDSAGNVGKTDGTPTTETGNVEEAPMPALASDEVMLAKVRVEAAVSVIATDKVVGRAIDISRHGFIIIKPADETVNNSEVLQDDDDLTFPVTTNATYIFTMALLTNSGTTPDFDFQWALPTSATADYLYITGTNVVTATDESTTPGIASDGADQTLLIIGRVVTAGTAGTAVMQWAQTTGTGSDTKVLANSWMRIERVA